jgi:glycosyltransferase involved in cell wall biosynthesis
MARAVLGLPMYRSEEFVGDVLRALLSLEFDDFAVVAGDDCSPDATYEVASAYAREDPRLVVERNTERLGMIGNWNRVLARAYELHPTFEYFAWASDNDLREPTWLSVLVRELEADPEAAIAYSRFGTFDENGRSDERAARWLFESRGIDNPIPRFRVTKKGLRAGPVMYGLHRRTTLDLVGDVPEVLLSDVLFLSHLSLYGTFVQAPEVLWYRGSRRTGGAARVQRSALFARPPRTTYLPVSLQHGLWLLRRLVIEDQRPPGVTRARALTLAIAYAPTWWGRLLRRKVVRRKKWARTRMPRLARRLRKLRKLAARSRVAPRRLRRALQSRIRAAYGRRS